MTQKTESCMTPSTWWQLTEIAYDIIKIVTLIEQYYLVLIARYDRQSAGLFWYQVPDASYDSPSKISIKCTE